MVASSLQHVRVLACSLPWSTRRIPASPRTRARAQARIRRLTGLAVVLAGGATVCIGLVVAKEHPGTSAGSNPSATTPPTTAVPGGTATPSSPVTAPTTTVTGPPTTTTTRPVVTSGGTSRR